MPKLVAWVSGKSLLGWCWFSCGTLASGYRGLAAYVLRSFAGAASVYVRYSRLMRNYQVESLIAHGDILSKKIEEICSRDLAPGYSFCLFAHPLGAARREQLSKITNFAYLLICSPSFEDAVISMIFSKMAPLKKTFLCANLAKHLENLTQP